MTGRIKISVSNRNLKYDFEIKRKITVIQGDSGTGKTTLLRLIEDYSNFYPNSGIELSCSHKCLVMPVNKELAYSEIPKHHESVLFFDENASYVKTREFAELLFNSDCYFVIITRDDLATLPVSIEEIYTMTSSGKYQNTRKTYNFLKQIYRSEKHGKETTPSVVIVEDSNSGFEMYQSIFKSVNPDINVISANGKSNISRLISEHDEPSLAIVDGAAFGADIRNTVRIIDSKNSACLWAPESFEYLLLKTQIVDIKNLKDILENTENYADSKYHSSWETFFTELLIAETHGSIYEYSKKSLNTSFLTDGNRKKFCEQMPFDIKL